MNKNRHLISKYLEGELDAITAARFEEELEKDQVLRQELELYKEVDEALADTEIMEFRMQLHEMHKELSPEIYSTSKPRYKRIAVFAAAASLALILSLSAIGLFRSDTNQNLLEKFYQPYAVTSTTRSGGPDSERELRYALEKYQNQEYKVAVLLFEKVLETNPRQMGTQLYAGISYFEIEEYKKAGKSFTKIIEHNDNLYIEQAQWYLGFCYLKTEEKDKAINQFTEIANSDSYYNEKAKTILKKLR